MSRGRISLTHDFGTSPGGCTVAEASRFRVKTGMTNLLIEPMVSRGRISLAHDFGTSPGSGTVAEASRFRVKPAMTELEVMPLLTGLGVSKLSVPINTRKGYVPINTRKGCDNALYYGVAVQGVVAEQIGMAAVADKVVVNADAYDLRFCVNRV